MNFIKHLLGKKPTPVSTPTPLRPIKDPNDFTLTDSSTEWGSDICCSSCLASTSHRERMANVCNSCGDVEMRDQWRSYRQIWNGTKWIWQYKYPGKIVLSENPAHSAKQQY